MITITIDLPLLRFTITILIAIDYPKKTWNKLVKPYQEDVTAKGRSFQPGSVRHPSSIAQAGHIVDTPTKRLSYGRWK